MLLCLYFFTFYELPNTDVVFSKTFDALAGKLAVLEANLNTIMSALNIVSTSGRSYEEHYDHDDYYYYDDRGHWD